ncbi:MULTISPECIES: RagB/SusD family nutrient uptake outer membrane protein [Butyricimonas]|uniref:RagB/SusD family nutrient uptake outer membrane protein n=1 Tax=Butyricimonas TaxID=574697 RepID=UPI001D093FDD|nr:MULTISPECIES: RagB/SusD family nutrient uptake outer membrane protein [Butyricimonas]MCB6974741.1 RagB/SusD family nutrient uptake outer membrane protein [Butyricimonas synergistica]MCG4521483.1 RagB/SusD family nutrient uptake outer membrane protein [Butyricimonas sp. DFI.6.44]
MRLKLLLLFLAFCFIQCSDFLEEQSQSEIRPSTVSDMEKILETMAYPTSEVGTLLARGTEIFTDNVRSNIVTEASYISMKEKELWRFRWDPQMFNEGGGGNDITFWSLPYDRIKGCHLILEYIDDMIGNDNRKAHIKGEVYALRAYYYFSLVNFFGLPYNYGDPSKNLGVPLKLTSGVTDEKFKRNTVKECYDQIIEDLNNGIDLMKANQEGESKLIARMRYTAGYALLSRVYLHMNDWDRVITYADSVLDVRPQLLDMKETSTSSTGVYHEYTPTEALWAVRETFDDNWNMMKPCSPSWDLTDLYTMWDMNYEGASDRRLQNNTLAFFRKDSWSVDGLWRCVIKGQMGKYWNNGGIRTSEVYLNRAEAYIRKYIVSGNRQEAQQALDDLNMVRRHRFDKNYVDFTLNDFANADELLAFCLRERRRELCYESNHRWFDLRRLGMPEIKHVFVDQDNGYETEYVLQKEDPRYVLPIPNAVTERNPNLKGNE